MRSKSKLMQLKNHKIQTNLFELYQSGKNNLLYGNAQSQTAAKIHACGGRGPQTPPKTKQEKVTEINTKLTSKSVSKWDGTLKSTGKYNASIF